MAKNKKTIFKSFDYTQCDDFASFLQSMAAKGWHFQQWGAGLIFEKGEPRDVTYAVEAFVKGSEKDLRPNVDTLEFAEYCKAAGWELVDSKQKFCIFKKVDADAVPIQTPQERVKNAAKAQAMRNAAQLPVLLYLIIIVSASLARVDAFENIVFSNSLILSLLFCPIFALLDLAGWGALLWWKLRAMKKAKNDEFAPLSSKANRVISTLQLLTAILFLLGYITQGDLFKLAWVAIYMGTILILGWILAKFRPDPDTASTIRIVTAVILFMFMLVVAVIQFTITSENNAQNKENIPLLYSDLGVDNGSIEYSSIREENSILGSHKTYYLHYEPQAPMQQLNYTLYLSEHDWILDHVWDENRGESYNQNATDHTASWGAVEAYRNQAGTFYVRYDDAILILYTEIAELTPAQIDIVLENLQLR